MFCGLNYQFWKVRMRIFIESIDRGVRDAIVNGPYVPKMLIDNVYVDKPWCDWIGDESRKAQYASVAKNIITSSLNLDEFFKVSQCTSAKEMWDVLEVTREGTSDVKRARKHALIQEYELFRMKPGETLAKVQKRFTHVVNHLIGLYKVFNKEKLNIKILKCLDKSWQPKVTAFSKTRDLSTLTSAALFGKLREYELEMIRFNEQENGDRKQKGIALKSVVQKEDSDDECSSSCSETETLMLLTRKFSKFLKKKVKEKSQPFKRFNNKKIDNSTNITCFGCGKQGHIKMNCPNQAPKKTASEKRYVKNKKQRRAYIASEDNDTSFSSSLDKEEETNLCMMAGHESDSSVSSSISFTHENYSTLLNAFKETHEEANCLNLSNNRLKGLNSWLENRAKQLEEELQNMKIDFESLDMIYKSSSSNCSQNGKVTNCENCEVLQGKVNYLIKIVSKLSMGTTNLNALLGSQNCVFNKASIGFQDGLPKKVKKFSSFFYHGSISYSSLVTCFYCLERGHTIRRCRTRLYYLPKVMDEGPSKV